MSHLKSDKNRIYSSQFLAGSEKPSHSPHQHHLHQHQQHQQHQIQHQDPHKNQRRRQSHHLPHDTTTISIFNSLTGTQLLINPFSFNSLDSLKDHIASCFNIPQANLFILTPFGIKLKFSMILHDQVNELYVFDRNCFNLNNSELTKLALITEQESSLYMLRPVESPLVAYQEVYNEDNLRGTVNALKRNSGWAAAMLSDCKKKVASSGSGGSDTPTASTLPSTIQIVVRSLNVLIQYLSLTAQTLQKNFTTSLEYYESLKQNSMVDQWEPHYRDLKKIEMKLMPLGTGQNSTLLFNLAHSLNKSELLKVAKEAASLSLEIDRILELVQDKVDNEIVGSKRRLELDYALIRDKYYHIRESTPENVPKDLLKDLLPDPILQLESLVQQIIEDVNDLPTLLTTANNKTNAADFHAINSCYQTHLHSVIPQITSIIAEIYHSDLSRSKTKKSLQKSLFEFIFNRVLAIQINLINTQKTIVNELQPKLQRLQSLEVQLSIVIDLPLIFGILMISKFKNYRWFENFRKIFFKTTEIFEMMRIIELNGRTKWVEKFIGGNGNGLNLSNQFMSNSFDHLVLNQYLNLIGVLKQEEFVSDYLPVFESNLKPNQQGSVERFKMVLEKEHSRFPDKNALNKFISSLNTSVGNGSSDDSVDNSCIWNYLQVTKVLEIQQYVQKLKTVLGENHLIVKKLQNSVNELNGADVGPEVGPVEPTFDINDLNFMKFYKKFLKNYDLDGFIIEFGEKQAVPVRNDDTVKGYENRIKKLENLLHQQQFLQFNQEFKPRTHRNLNPMNVDTLNVPSKSASVSPSSSQLQYQHGMLISLPRGRKFSSESNDGETVEAKDRQSPAGVNDPVLLKEIQSLKEQLAKSHEEKQVLEAENETLKADNRRLQDENSKLAAENDQAHDVNEIETLKEREKALADQLEAMEKTHSKERQKFTVDYEEANSMKNDLIENMAALQKDHEEERTNHLHEINELKYQVEELQQSKEEHTVTILKLNDALNDKNQVISGLCSIVESMYMKLKDLSRKTYIDKCDFCLVLESIGLLLVREDESGDRFKIIRVKGLKKSKGLGDQLHTFNSDFVSEIEKNLYWTELSIENETTSVKEMMKSSPLVNSAITGKEEESNEDRDGAGDADEDANDVDHSVITELDIHSKSLIHKFNNEEFELNYDGFVQSLFLKDGMMVESIIKRFKDVENLARKFQKDLNHDKEEIRDLQTLLSSKISIRNFQVEDLVLFLPTTDEFNRGTDNNKKSIDKKQWALFNIGAPHFFLDNSENVIELSNRDWLVLRIKAIEEHKINEENLKDETENPFNLGIGISWYSVVLEEENVFV